MDDEGKIQEDEEVADDGESSSEEEEEEEDEEFVQVALVVYMQIKELFKIRVASTNS